MQMTLIDNAMDSLNWALKHLKTFLKKDPYFENREKSATDLKQSIINLNSCLELFFKKYLSDSNELLIYDFKECSSELLEYYREKHCDKTTVPIYDYFVLNNIEVKTIQYSKCIDYFCEIYGVGKAYSSSFKSLNELRNSIMHLGVNYKSQYYILVGCIDKALWFIHYEILRKLGLQNRSNTRLEASLLQIEGALAEIEDTLWKQIYDQSINNIVNKLEEIFNSIEVQEYLKNKKRKIEFYATSDMEFASARMTVADNGLDEEIFAAYNDHRTRSLVINDGQQDAIVFAAFPLSEEGKVPHKFYCSKSQDGVEVKSIDHQTDFWLQSDYKNEFYYFDYTNQNLFSLMKKMIDFCDMIEFISIN